MRIAKEYIYSMSQLRFSKWNGVSTKCKIHVCKYHIELYKHLEDMYKCDLEENDYLRGVPSASKIQEICKKRQEIISKHIRRTNAFEKLYTKILRSAGLSGSNDYKMYKLLIESCQKTKPEYVEKKELVRSWEKNLEKALDHFKSLVEDVDFLQGYCKEKLESSTKNRKLHEEELNGLKNK